LRRDLECANADYIIEDFDELTKIVKSNYWRFRKKSKAKVPPVMSICFILAGGGLKYTSGSKMVLPIALWQMKN